MKLATLTISYEELEKKLFPDGIKIRGILEQDLTDQIHKRIKFVLEAQNSSPYLYVEDNSIPEDIFLDKIDDTREWLVKNYSIASRILKGTSGILDITEEGLVNGEAIRLKSTPETAGTIHPKLIPAYPYNFIEFLCVKEFVHYQAISPKTLPGGLESLEGPATLFVELLKEPR